MTPRIPDNVSGGLAEWSLISLIDDMLPPRDPDDDDEEEEEEENGAEEEEPAVIREPDE